MSTMAEATPKRRRRRRRFDDDFKAQAVRLVFDEGKSVGAVGIRRTTSLFMGIPKARVICCAIRGHPQIGFRCFMSATAAMTSWLGPLGPGFVGPLDEKSR